MIFWIISFITSWIVFFILVDIKKLKKLLFVGGITIAFQLYVDYFAIKYGLYQVNDPGIKIFNSSVFFAFGIPMTLGMVFVQYLPKKNACVKLLNILIWSSLFILFELLALYVGILKYNKWNLFNSFTVNMGVFIILSWIGENFVKINNQR